MQIIKTSKKPILTILCLTHGDEVFGKEIFDYFTNNTTQYPGLQLILCNEEAYSHTKRFIETDLNRSYPGNQKGSHEERLAYKITPLIASTPYMIDVHNTKTDMQMVPIISTDNEDVRAIISFTKAKYIALMPRKTQSASTIDMSLAGVGLEFNEKYAKTKAALNEVIKIVKGITQKKQNADKLSRTIFEIAGTIPLDVKLPKDATNFHYYKEIPGYTFLVGDNSYKDHQGFYATKTKKIKL